MMERERKAVVLLSGGIDSSTTLAVVKSEGYELYVLSFDYNQRHKRELKSAHMVATTLGVKRHLIIKCNLREIGGSALTSDIDVPKSARKLEGLEDQKSENIPVTYVPARNTIFLGFALAWAEVLEAEDIFIGANVIDYSGYPDCRPEYFWAFEDMANLATKASVEGRLRFMIRAPLITMKKSAIIKKGSKLGLDYALTWSCYDPQIADSRRQRAGRNQFISNLRPLSDAYVPCGSCDSCLLRTKGFEEAGIKDPLVA